MFTIMFILAIKLITQIIAFVMDNATNNDMMMEAIEQHCNEANIYFSTIESQLCCMPHTVHLAAIKVSLLFFCVFVRSSNPVTSSLKGLVPSQSRMSRQETLGVAITRIAQQRLSVVNMTMKQYYRKMMTTMIETRVHPTFPLP